MPEFDIVKLVALPIFLGLFGFVEHCSIGSTLIMVKQIEGGSGPEKITQILVFAGSRALVIGLLGVVAAPVGSAFIGWLRGLTRLRLNWQPGPARRTLFDEP